MAIYKEAEFKSFIKIIEDNQVCHWIQIAVALNVNKNTITAWKKLPEAQEALAKGISNSLACMQQAGTRDWRMWESKLKMLGLTTPQIIETNLSNDPRLEILENYGLKVDDEFQTYK